MSERYVAEKVGIIDNHGERKGVCVTDTEHTVSFEVKDENVALRLCDLLNEQQATINKQEEIIKSQDMEISRQYNLCLAMSGILREEFGVYDVFDRTKDKNIKKEDD